MHRCSSAVSEAARSVSLVEGLVVTSTSCDFWPKELTTRRLPRCAQSSPVLVSPLASTPVVARMR
jgi:hypothetical protein